MVDAWCASCGERQLTHRDLSVRALIRAGAEEFLGFDGKIARTLWALISKPGLLTREFIQGRRGVYSKPFALFITLNLVFFLIQPYTHLVQFSLRDYTAGKGRFERNAREMVEHRLSARSETLEMYRVEFDRTLADQKRSMLLVSIPFLAMVMALMFIGSGRYFVEHLVFSVHAYAFFLVLLTLGLYLIYLVLGGWIMLCQLVGVPINWFIHLISGERGVLSIHMLLMGVYLLLALRRAYGLRWRWAVPAGLFLAGVQMLLVLGFRMVLFYTTWLVT